MCPIEVFAVMFVSTNAGSPPGPARKTSAAGGARPSGSSSSETWHNYTQERRLQEKAKGLSRKGCCGFMFALGRKSHKQCTMRAALSSSPGGLRGNGGRAGRRPPERRSGFAAVLRCSLEGLFSDAPRKIDLENRYG